MKTVFMTILMISILTAILNPDYINGLMNNIVGFTITVMIIAIASSIKILGSGLSDQGSKILFAVVMLLALTFQVSFSIDPIGLNVSLGLGLFQNMINVLSVMPFGLILGYGLAITGIISGLFTIMSI